MTLYSPHFQEWTGDFFNKAPLHRLGLVVTLGDHHAQALCRLSTRKRIVVLHTNGLHEINVDVCGCRLNLEMYQQLLRISWFPATPCQPETCATIELLELFHSLNLQGNLTVYDFVKTLESLTDGWRLESLPVSVVIVVI